MYGNPLIFQEIFLFWGYEEGRLLGVVSVGLFDFMRDVRRYAVMIGDEGSYEGGEIELGRNRVIPTKR